MRACVMQPPYSRSSDNAEALFQWKLDALAQCDSSLDLLVLPEYSDIPCDAETMDETMVFYNKYNAILLAAAADTAAHCRALVFVNALSREESGFRNTTFVFNRYGNLAGKYFKKHLPPSEHRMLAPDYYTLEPSDPYILELDGLRIAFLTCYDFYFYEAFSNIARQNVDLIIGCSLQRSDTHEALEIMCRFCAYNCNAYLMRSSVTFGEDSPVCGSSMIVSPFGKVLANLRAKPGMAYAEFDPKEKYYKPAGYGGRTSAHYEYMEWGRRPWQYRPAGPFIVPPDDFMPYPRSSAEYRASADSAMSFLGSAIGRGVQELSLTLAVSSDNEVVCVPSDAVYEGPPCTDAQNPTLASVLQKFSCHAVFALHISTADTNMVYQILETLHRYDCKRHCYFVSETAQVFAGLNQLAPEIPTMMLARPNIEEINQALQLGCSKICIRADATDLELEQFSQLVRKSKSTCLVRIHQKAERNNFDIIQRL